VGNEPSRPSNGPIAGVFFDLGGTLYSYEFRSLMGQANGAALKRLGFDPSAPEVRAAGRAAASEIQKTYAVRRSFIHRDLFRDRLARTATLLGVAASAAELEQFCVENTRNIIEHMPPRHDAVATLRSLRSRGLYCSVVSNADDEYLGVVIERHGLDQLLDDWTSSEEADSCKPDVQIYEVALAKAQLEPTDVLFVGDSLHHDVAGAHAAGIRSVLFEEPDVTTPLTEGLTAAAEPDYVIHDLAELAAIVDGLNT
jgi:putative hydrolase of the HAD superfamily